MNTAQDYVRADKNELSGSSQISNRFKLVYSSHEPNEGDFLARLWTLFGSPDESEDGFSYVIKHVPTGKVFEAYFGASGQNYGGNPSDKELERILEDFENILRSTPLADCEYEFDMSDYGRFKAGAKDGVPFSDALDESEI